MDWTWAAIAAAALIFLALAWRLRNGHRHKWGMEGIFPGGSMIEVCSVCERRKVFVYTESGEPGGIQEYHHEEWKELGYDKAQAKDLRGRDELPESIANDPGEKHRSSFGGKEATRFWEQRLRERGRNPEGRDGGPLSRPIPRGVQTDSEGVAEDPGELAGEDLP